VAGGSKELLVTYSFLASVTISCSMNLDRYPFADTTCRYRMTSQSLDTSRLLFAVNPVFNVSGLLDTKESFHRYTQFLQTDLLYQRVDIPNILCVF